MKTFQRLLFLVALAAPLAVPMAAQAAVEVTYTNPDKFFDVGPYGRYGSKERAAVLSKLRAHMESLDGRYLKPGQTLKIEVLDLDLAGRLEWWHPSAYDIRIMRAVDSPSMKVRYVLEENGATRLSGEERISDMTYLMGLHSAGRNSDTLTYEKTMLSDWFRNRFGKLNAAAN